MKKNVITLKLSSMKQKYTYIKIIELNEIKCTYIKINLSEIKCTYIKIILLNEIECTYIKIIEPIR